MLGALFLAGLFLHGAAGAVLLLVVAAVLAALTRAAWPHLPERGRPARLLVLAVVVAVAFGKLIGFG